MTRRLAVIAAVSLFASNVFATMFIVPDDRELVQKSDGIVVGVVVDATPHRRTDGDVETLYNVRLQRVLKGDFKPGSTLQVTSIGGTIKDHWTFVAGAAHFKPEDRVLLFLVRDRGTWTPTDMTLGKFKFVTSTGGQALLLRDAEDIVGFDREMRTHVEKIRREATFLQFIDETVKGQEAEANYFVSPAETVSIPDETTTFPITTNTVYTAESYAIHFSGTYPGRWPEARMTSVLSRPFFKSTLQSASGLGDGGVQMITDALNAWTSDCPSYVNIVYGGTNGLLKDGNDDVNTVIWNDPGGHIPGSWTGAGVVATAFMSGDNFHTFDGLTNGWVSLSDADVVVQNGLTGAESFIPTALTHEVGHAIGLRHANTHHDGTACQGTDECTTSAIMNSSVNSAFLFALQAWDQNAIRALYPTACISFTAPTNVVATATSATTVSITWNAVAGATNYRVHRASAQGSYVTEFNAGASTSYTDTTAAANTAYQYVVRAGDGSSFSTFSDDDFATTVVFTDSTLNSTVPVKLVHFTQLLTAVNAVRTLTALAPISFTSPTPATLVTVRKAHIDDLRTAIAAARGVLGLSTSFAETLTAGATTIKASHLTELRNAVQ